MYKTYLKHGKVFFYERGIEINGVIYGIHSEEDIRRIKRRIVQSLAERDEECDTGEECDTEEEYNLEAEIDKLIHTDIVFEQPTAKQLAQIQSRRFENPREARTFVDEVMSDTHTPSQDEINAAVMLEIAKLKAGV